jgi:hypothetical protein
MTEFPGKSGNACHFALTFIRQRSNVLSEEAGNGEKFRELTFRGS